MSNLALDPIATLNSEADVIAAISALQALNVSYEATRLTNFNLCNPETRIAEIDVALGTAALEGLADLQEEKVALQALGTNGKLNARGKVAAEFAPNRAAILALCDILSVHLTSYKATTEAAEDGLADTYDQPYFRTSISTRYVAGLAEVARMKAGWLLPYTASSLPQVGNINVLTYLGASPTGE